MILHLISEDKFADYAIQQFYGVSNNSHFVVILDSETEIRHIKQIDKVEIVILNSSKYRELLTNLSTYSAIVVHGLFFPWQEQIILAAPEHIKIAWGCWGGEIYGRKELLSHFLDQRTKWIYWEKQIKRMLKLKPLLGKEFFVNKKTFQRINFCLSDMPEEYEYVKHFCKSSSMEYLWYNYYSIEETLGELKYENVRGSNILVGNSCSLENNHLDVFNLLKKLNLQQRKIIVPLSYGSNWLRLIIICKGEKYFKENFMPLNDFLDRKSYNKILCTCPIMIMNHIRPQAQGNIITGLWLGAKVYLNNKSITYSYFKSLGIHIFSIENDLKPSNRKALLPLEKEMVEQNRKILMQQYGLENVMEKTKLIVNTLSE